MSIEIDPATAAKLKKVDTISLKRGRMKLGLPRALNRKRASKRAHAPRLDKRILRSESEIRADLARMLGAQYQAQMIRWGLV